MTKNEVKTFMLRVKSYYQSFIIDEFKTNEWFNALKDYDNSEVNKRFEEHLQSETYGQYIPQISYLTKFLKKVGEKKETPADIFINCSICGKRLSLQEQENHYDRCHDIDYINWLSEKYRGKPINKDKYWELEDTAFYRAFLGTLAWAMEQEPNVMKQEMYNNIYQDVKLCLQGKGHEIREDKTIEPTIINSIE